MNISVVRRIGVCVAGAVALCCLSLPLRGGVGPDFTVILEGTEGDTPLDSVLEVKADDITWDWRAIHEERGIPPKGDLALPFPGDGGTNPLAEAAAAGYRVYGPGDAHYGSITIRRSTADGRNELSQWYQDVLAGCPSPRTITLIALVRDERHTEDRLFTFFDCVPTSYRTAPEGTPGATLPAAVAVETIVCKVGRVELAASVPPPDLTPGKSTVVLTTSDEGESSSSFGWSSVRGGGLRLHRVNPLRRFSTHVTTPGYKSVEALTLGGPLTPGRKALCDWITAAVEGKPWKRHVEVTEMAAPPTTRRRRRGRTKSFTYLDCFPTRYVFPSFSSAGTGNLREEFTLKPIRMEVY